MATHNEPARVAFERLQPCIAQAFIHVGTPHADARTVGTLMAMPDRQGSDGHGVTHAAMARDLRPEPLP